MFSGAPVVDTTGDLYGGTINAQGWWIRPDYPSEPSPTGTGVRRAVSTTGELNTAIAAAGPGDVIVLADGTYTDPDTAGFSDGGVQCNGTEIDPIIFYAATQHGALIRHTDVNKLTWYQTESYSYIEIWGLDLEADATCYRVHGHGSYAKWCKMVSTDDTPVARHRRNTATTYGGRDLADRMLGGGVWFCDITNTVDDASSEGHYIGVGEVPGQNATDHQGTNHQDGVSTIGCYFVGCSGGAIDVKVNCFNYIAEYNVCDGVDWTSGVINLNSGLYLVPPSDRSSLGGVDDYICRNNIVRMTDSSTGSSSAAHGARLGGPCTFTNNILFAAHTGGSGDAFGAISIHTKGGQSGGTYPSLGIITCDMVVGSNRGYGFDAFSTLESNSGTDTISYVGESGFNKSDTALGEVSGDVVADSLYVGPVSGLAIDDTEPLGGGMGTGFKMVGASTGYQVLT